MIYLGDKAIGVSHRAFLNWDKVAQGTEDLSMFNNICLSDEVTTIADNAFSCFPIINITGHCVTKVSYRGFYNCRNLSSINFENVETVESEAFRYCSHKIAARPFPKLKTIGNNAFRDCSIDYVIAPEVTQIGSDAFYSNQNLKCTDLGNRSIVSGFTGTSYCFEQNADCIVILRYGYVLPAVALWFYSNCWLKHPTKPGTLYVWQDLIDGYQNHAVWGPLLAANGNQILPIEGSVYETEYGDGTPIT